MRSIVIERLQLGAWFIEEDGTLIWCCDKRNPHADKLRAMCAEARKVGGNVIVSRNLDKIKGAL